MARTPQQIVNEIARDSAEVFVRARPRTIIVTVDDRTTARITRKFDDVTVDYIHYLSLTIVQDQIKRQMALDNPPVAILYDNSPTKPISQQRYRIDVFFGKGIDARPAMNKLMAEVTARAPRGIRWQWIAKLGPNSDRTAAQLRSKTGPVYLQFTDVLYLVQLPHSVNPDATYSNILYKNRMLKDSRGRLNQGTKGYASQAAGAFRRSRESTGFWAGAGFTVKYAGGRRTLPPGTGFGRSNRISRFTGKPMYFQGAIFFTLRLSRGRLRRR